jgi:hypothetical protein
MFAGSGYRGKSDSSLSLPIRRIQLLFSVMIETILEGVKTKGGDGWLVVSWVEATIADCRVDQYISVWSDFWTIKILDFVPLGLKMLHGVL